MTRWLLTGLVLLGCDDGGGGAPIPDMMGGEADGGVAEDAGLDVGPPDLSVDAEPPDAAADPDAAPPPIPGMEAATPTPFAVQGWIVGRVRGDDAVFSRIEQGRFEAPEDGELRDGVQWRAQDPDAEGAFGDWGNGVGYAVARITVEARTHLLARLDRVLELVVNGERLPGDLYGDGRQRLPIRLEPGENLVVLRAYGSRGAPRVAFWETPDPLAFNTADLTAPHLRVGQDDPQHVGVPMLVFGETPITAVRALVMEDERFAASRVEVPSLPAGAVTQLAFALQPKAPWVASEEPVSVRLRVESPDLEAAYEQRIELAISAEGAYRRTFRSPTDHSVQYYGVQPPPEVDPDREYALVLSLHGAGVQGLGQARAYGAKDWAYIIAPTNRRPFGFDWEEWGRLNGLNALADAMDDFRIDSSRLSVTGHSMGGHGTWHLGVHDAGRWAVVAPSAGWSSFYSYTGAARPSGPFARSRAHSETMDYLENLTDKAVFIIHGSADDNVPVREGRAMRDASMMISEDVHYHEEEGAGHWWDNDPDTPGAACVDWGPLFELMQDRSVDPGALDFHFRSPSPAYNPRRAYVTVTSVQSADRDFTLDSARREDEVELTTDNVRSLILDGDALAARGVASAVVDGEAHAVQPGPMALGPQGGKRAGVQGPFNQVFHRPHCYIYPDRAADLRQFAAYMTSTWALIGNGHACALPASQADLAGDRNRIYLGLEPDDLGDLDLPFDWDDLQITYAGRRFVNSALMFVFDDGDRLGALLTFAGRADHLLYRIVPFSSRAGMPDYLLWSEEGGRAAGFFDADWRAGP